MIVRRPLRSLAALALCVWATALPLWAAEPVAADKRSGLFLFTLMAGATSKPSYFGSDETSVGPAFRPDFGYLRFLGVSVGDDDAPDADPQAQPAGIGLRGAFRYVGARRAGDHEALTGLEDVDGAFELGLGLGYAAPGFEALGELRYGLTGHESLVGELSANLVSRPIDGLALRVGPRVVIGSDRYAETYFGITDPESGQSGLPAFEAGGGLVSAGVEMTATWQLGTGWWLEGTLRHDRLQNDAARSPITQAGSDAQTTLRLGVRRAFVLEF